MKYRVPSKHQRRTKRGGPRDPRISIPGITLTIAQSFVPGTASGTPAAVINDPPAGWTLEMEDTFDGVAIDGANWQNRTFTGGAHCDGGGCAATWDGGAGISVENGNMRLRVARNGASWNVTGLQQGGGSQFNFHPGYGEFHVRFRARFTASRAPGIGFYGLMWPWHNGWSTELDIVETPGQVKNRSSATVHWDTEISNFQVGGEFSGPDLSQFNTWDCRRTYTFLNGRKVARIEVWMNGQKLVQANGQPYDEIDQNIFEVEPMQLGFATYVRCPTRCIAWFSDIDATTPNEAFLEVDFVRIWRPEPAVAAAQVARVDILLRGADSAAAMVTAGGATEIARVVRSLTGIATVNIVASNTGNRTTHLNSATSDVAGSIAVEWLTGQPTTAPTTWTAQAPLTQTIAAMTAGISTDPAHPLLDVALHWELDLQQTGDNAAAYASGRGEVSRRISAAAGKVNGKYAVFDAYCPTTTGVQAAMVGTINTAWAGGVYQPNTIEALGLGQAQDCVAVGGLWNAAGAMQAATRIGIRLARYCFEKGWTANDLAGLPGLGMNIGGVKRDTDTTKMVVYVQHDRGSDIVIPSNVNAAAFTVTDGTTTRTGTAVTYRTSQSFIVTFDGAIPAAAGTLLRHTWTPGFFAPGTLVSDNFHTSDVYKPGVIGTTSGVGTMTLPLQRTVAAIPLDAGDVVVDPTNTVRGRPVIVNNTIMTAERTLMRGATMALDGPGTPATNFAIDRANWAMLRAAPFNLNVVRLDIRGPSEGGPPLPTHYADLDTVVENAAATGMYLLLMQSAGTFTPDWQELRGFWTYAASRYQGRTHVFYEMTNEPGGDPVDFPTSMMQEIKRVYDIMRAGAPNTLIGVLDFSYPHNAANALAAIQRAIAAGVPIGAADNCFVATHLYDTASSVIGAMRDAHPTMATEHVYGGPQEDDVFRLGEMERLGISWVSLCGRFPDDQVSYPYGAEIGSLRDRVLPGMHTNGYNWTADVIGSGGGGGGGTRSPVFSTNIATAVLGAVTNVTVTGLIPNEPFEWTVVQNNATFTWRTDPPTRATADANGRATLAAIFVATGDFLKLLFDSRSVGYDSVRVTTVPVIIPPTGDAAFAAEWHRTLQHGINFERFRPLSFTYNGVPYRSGAAGWNYIKTLGVTHVRFFYAWDAVEDFAGDGITMNSGRRPTLQKIRDFLDPISQCCLAGLKAWVDFTDVANLDSINAWRSNVNAHFTDFCNEIKARPELSPDKLMVGQFNELVEWQGVGTNAHWNPVRMETHALIRAILPNHIIAHGAANWCSPDRLTASDWQVPPDKRTMGSAHHYDSADNGRPFLAAMQATFDDFTTRHGIPVIVGEAADDFDHRFGSDPANLDRWVRQYTDTSIAGPRMKACWWALNNPGNWYSLVPGGGTDNFFPTLEAGLRATAGNWAK